MLDSIHTQLNISLEDWRRHRAAVIIHRPIILSFDGLIGEQLGMLSGYEPGTPVFLTNGYCCHGANGFPACVGVIPTCLRSASLERVVRQLGHQRRLVFMAPPFDLGVKEQILVFARQQKRVQTTAEIKTFPP